MNRERIQQLIKLTKTHPHVFTMGRWLEMLGPEEPICETVEEVEDCKDSALACLSLSPKECGTVGCIAGWSLVLFDPAEAEDGNESILKAAKLRLDLTDNQAYQLFYQDDWPTHFISKMRIKYNSWPLVKGKSWAILSEAIKVRERLKYLLATGT